MAIQRTADELSQFNGFSKWRPSAILDLLCAYLDHPRRAFGGVYHCKNLVEIDAGTSVICNF